MVCLQNISNIKYPVVSNTDKSHEREREKERDKAGVYICFPPAPTNLISQFTFLNANPSWKMVKFICEWGEGEKYGLTPCKIYTPVCERERYQDHI